eukprot:comp22398_c0_seq1/m.33446 comp22398_c0_seq1/g.33446  ORF comp22398_c0_seq1/g.33446 comp22398_c0_seq1/m.33446 type:complete len:499 (-) comp22398_c0_seq1:774-2270(-)
MLSSGSIVVKRLLAQRVVPVAAASLQSHVRWFHGPTVRTARKTSDGGPASLRKRAEPVHTEPFYRLPGREPKVVTADEAVQLINSNDHVYIHGAAATPLELMEALGKWGEAGKLRNVRLHHIHLEGEAFWTTPQLRDAFRSNSLFIGANARRAVNEGYADFTPVFLSEIPALFRKRTIPLNVALIQISPPDHNGFASLGTSVDCTRAAVQGAEHIIALVNPQMPRSHGGSFIHISHLDYIVPIDRPLPECRHGEKDENGAQKRIGQFIADYLVDDGACLQMGIGAIPDAVLNQLTQHRDLGIHTEMFSDGVVDLYHHGAITNANKKVFAGKIVSGFVNGTKKVYEFIHDNPLIEMSDITFVNDPSIISMNPKVVAINSCIEVDITGQVCADSIGTRMYSGVGGQMDFMRGAALSEGGRPIIALPSVTRKGESRITPWLKPGAGVVTTRAHVHYIVTEYGIAELHGKNLRERAEALIKIAHPNHRDMLLQAAHERNIMC